MLKPRRSQARGLFLTFICCSLVAVLLAAPVLHSVSSAVAVAKAGAPASVGASSAGASKEKKEKTK